MGESQDNTAQGPSDIRILDLGTPELAAADGFDRAWMLGTWAVAWSTLPMWRNKQDVTITYTRRSDTTDTHSILDSDVAYCPVGGGAVSHVRGTERVQPTGATEFQWRGDSWLAFVTSHWWVRAWGTLDGIDWMFIYFTKTLFTPRGMDVLIREGGDEAARQRVRDTVVAAVKAHLGSETDTGFDVASAA